MPKIFTCYVVGDDSLLIQCSEVLLERGHVIYGIVSSNPNILNWANTNGIEALNFSDGWISHLRSNKYEYLFSIANLSVLPDEIINSPKKCAINYHDGPLPKYAGVNVTSWAIMDQRKAERQC